MNSQGRKNDNDNDADDARIQDEERIFFDDVEAGAGRISPSSRAFDDHAVRSEENISIENDCSAALEETAAVVLTRSASSPSFVEGDIDRDAKEDDEKTKNNKDDDYFGNEKKDNMETSAHSNEHNQTCGGGDTLSLMTSELAAAPPPVMARRRLPSLPGAFRIQLFGSRNTSSDEESSADGDRDTEFIPNPPETDILVEATLVPEERAAECRDVFRNEEIPTAPANVALVEAKAVSQSWLCNILGSWRALCFVILVIIAIVGVAMLLERSRDFPNANMNNYEAPGTSAEQVSTLKPTASSVESANAPSFSEIETSAPTEIQTETETETTYSPTGSPTSFAMLDSTMEVNQSSSSFPTQRLTDMPSTALTGLIDLFNLPDSTREALDDPTSPQSVAMYWLEGDPMLEDYSLTQKMQRFVLATLYLSTKGELWRRQDHWLSYNHSECEWYTDVDEACSVNGTYQFLVLTENSVLDGTLPDETWLLSSLTLLNLQGQSALQGRIPAQIGTMTELTTLVLEGASLRSTIPTEMGLLSNRYVDKLLL